MTLRYRKPPFTHGELLFSSDYEKLRRSTPRLLMLAPRRAEVLNTVIHDTAILNVGTAAWGIVENRYS